MLIPWFCNCWALWFFPLLIVLMIVSMSIRATPGAAWEFAGIIRRTTFRLLPCISLLDWLEDMRVPPRRRRPCWGRLFDGKFQSLNTKNVSLLATMNSGICFSKYDSGIVEPYNLMRWLTRLWVNSWDSASLWNLSSSSFLVAPLKASLTASCSSKPIRAYKYCVRRVPEIIHCVWGPLSRICRY